MRARAWFGAGWMITALAACGGDGSRDAGLDADGADGTTASDGGAADATHHAPHCASDSRAQAYGRGWRPRAASAGRCTCAS